MMHPESKILPLTEALRLVAGWRLAGQRVVFTNGCFDLIHPGHLRYLLEARALGHRLVVGLNSDASVRGLKGEGRPIMDEQARALLLACNLALKTSSSAGLVRGRGCEPD